MRSLSHGGWMVHRLILPLLLIGLFWVARLEGRGQGHFGAKGSTRFGSQRNAGFAVGVRSYGRGFGHHSVGGCGLGFGSRYSRSSFHSGLYSPGYYGYNCYMARAPGAGSPISEYDEESQPYYAKAPVPDEKIDCKDTWMGGGNGGPLSGTMTRFLELQCGNGHTGSPPESKTPFEERSTRQMA
jgi:hypothetical protein